MERELVRESKVIRDVVHEHMASLVPGGQQCPVLADERLQASDRPVDVIIVILFLRVAGHDLPLDLIRARVHDVDDFISRDDEVSLAIPGDRFQVARVSADGTENVVLHITQISFHHI